MSATLNGAFPIVPYREPWAAIAWLEAAFGAQASVLSPSDPSEPFGHGEILIGTGIVMISDTGQGETSVFCLPGPLVVYVVVEDPDALHTQAVSAGAEIVMDLTDQDYGSREFAARDLEGNVWSFGTYSPARTKPVS
jgi:uncharacterized glyoxalase superfamily protein PhnB